MLRALGFLASVVAHPWYRCCFRGRWLVFIGINCFLIHFSFVTAWFTWMPVAFSMILIDFYFTVDAYTTIGCEENSRIREGLIFLQGF